MFPNEMVLAPLQKLKIKYELSYQSTTRLKYIDKFDQLLIIHQWTSTVDNTVRSLIHFTIFIWYYVVKHFPSLNNWCPVKMFIVLHVTQTTIAVTILHKIHYGIEVPTWRIRIHIHWSLNFICYANQTNISL
jgi:hypothetical protein